MIEALLIAAVLVAFFRQRARLQGLERRLAVLERMLQDRPGMAAPPPAPAPAEPPPAEIAAPAPPVEVSSVPGSGDPVPPEPSKPWWRFW